MLKVGLTGGIASGKSEAAAAFARLGVPVVDADAVSRDLTAPGAPGLAQLVATLGTEMLDQHGQLQRAVMRRQLFRDQDLRARVQAILHPLIIQRMQSALAAFRAPYAVAVIPLLIETPAACVLVDRVLVVDCPEALQLSRLMSRDGENEVTARAILATQASRSLRLAAGDDILINAGTLHELAAGVVELHQLYTDIAGPRAQSRRAARPPMSGTGI